jgi:molybdate transport system substrate-binding protein
LAACGGDSSSSSDTTTTTAAADTTTTAPALQGDITVFAAASLTDAFTQIGKDFEAANPGVHVTFNFAGSSTLAEQVNQGAPADVLATADESNMQKTTDAGSVTATAETFAKNELEIATPPGNPKSLTGLTDFGNADLLLGLCDAAVPCGKFGLQALTNAGVTPSIDTTAPDVRSLLTQVEAGELDGGIVYVTDVMSAGDQVTGVEIPEDQNVIATYPIAPVAASSHADVAAAFIAYLLSDAGQQTMAGYGFLAP